MRRITLDPSIDLVGSEPTQNCNRMLKSDTDCDTNVLVKPVSLKVVLDQSIVVFGDLCESDHVL